MGNDDLPRVGDIYVTLDFGGRSDRHHDSSVRVSKNMCSWAVSPNGSYGMLRVRHSSSENAKQECGAEEETWNSDSKRAALRLSGASSPYWNLHRPGVLVARGNCCDTAFSSEVTAT